MADETAAVKANETAEKVEAVAAAAPVETKADKAEAKPEAKAAPAKTRTAAGAPKSKRTARKAAASMRNKAATPARKRAAKPRRKPAAKPAPTRKTAPARVRAARIEGVRIMTKQTRTGVDAGIFATEQFQTVFGDVNERAKAAVERSAKIVEEFADLTRGNVEAMVASSKAAAKGVETLSQDAAEYSRKSFEEASAALKSFAEVKSATDFFKLQSDFARAAFDSAVAESARLSETVLKLAGDVAEPITSRYSVAAERVKSVVA